MADRRERIKELFHGAAVLSPQERGDYLDYECGDDADLRAEVESLLKTDDDAPREFMQAPAFGPREDEYRPARPERIGRYHIVDTLGRGGMSLVYLAEQDSPKRHVAIKVIQPNVVSRSLLRRFQHEAHLLGQLKHPGIAQIYEAGTAETDHGPMPYFAMEYIKGRPLDRFADENKLTPRQRLSLLAEVCDAVHHAHLRGILHRDLKPANILVEDPSGARPGRPDGNQQPLRPKVLDFGVARATDPEIKAITLETGPGQLIGTIPYMSPEQVAGSPADLDERSDVYALGVIAYLMLSGRLPHDFTNRSIPEACRMIREDDATSISAIRPDLRGDVATIIAKAIEKDRTRRYVSAAELAADIRRFLRDEPIIARPPTTWYQLQKFARRNKGLVAGVVMAGIALAIGLILAVQQAVVATRARALSEQREAASIREACRANITAASAAMLNQDIALARRSLDAVPEAFRKWEWVHLHSGLDQSLLSIPVGGGLPLGALAIVKDQGRRLVTLQTGPDTTIWPIEGDEPERPVIRSGTFLARSRRGLVTAAYQAGQLTVRRSDEETGRSYDLAALGAGTVQRVLIDDAARHAVWRDEHNVGHLDLQTERLSTIRVDSAGTNIDSIALSADGRVGIAAAVAGRPAVWNPATGEVTPIAGVSGFMRSVDFTPDGARLVGGMQDTTVRMWDVRTGELLATGRGHQNAVTDVVVAPDGRTVTSVSLDRTVRLWDTKKLAPLTVLHGHERAVWKAAFSADSTRLATVGEDRVIRLWDATLRSAPGTLIGHTGIVFPVVFSPRGSFIASAGWDGTIRLWDARTHEAISVIPVSANVVSALAFSPDETLLAAATDSGYLMLDLISGESRHPTDATAIGTLDRGPVRALAFDTDGLHVPLPWSFRDEQVRAWNTSTGDIELWSHDRLVEHRSPFVSPDGRHLMAYLPPSQPVADLRSARGDSGADLAVFELPTHRRVSLPALSGVFAFRPGTTGSAVLAARLKENRTHIGLWNLDTGALLGFLEGHADDVYAMAFSPDGSRIATGGRDSLRVWDADTLEEVVQLYGHKSFVWSVAFAPDGKQLVSGSGDGTVRVWDTEPMRARLDVRQSVAESVERLRPMIERLLEGQPDPHLVAKKVAADPGLTPHERAAALRILIVARHGP